MAKNILTNGRNKFNDKNILLKYLANILFFSVILVSIYTSLSLNTVGRSLWYDEAALAYSISERTFFELVSRPLDWNQSAPVIYLYIVKIITLIFGNTEISLRFWSFISYVLSILLVYYISKNLLKVKFPLLITAFVSSLSVMMLYSVEFKPYMSDCSSILLCFMVYFLYSEKKIKNIYTILIYAAFVWYSNPSCFFIGGVLLFEFIDGLIRKEYSRVKFSILCGIVVCISFIIYFLYWLKPVIDTGHMANFWENKYFPLIPTSFSDIKKQKELTLEIISHLGLYKYLIFCVVFSGVFLNFFLDKNRYISVIYIGMIITLFASMLGMYPVQDRLYLFVYPIIAILFFYYFNKLFSDRYISNMILIIISVVILFSADGIFYYRNKYNILREYGETNPAVEYIEKNIDKEEKLYVFYRAVPGFCYKNGFNKSSIGNFKDNVILGKSLFRDKKNEKDIELILANSPIYILSSIPYQNPMIKPLFDSLNSKGYLEHVYDTYATSIYYYCDEKAKQKLNCSYEIVEMNQTPEVCKVTIRIHNLGESFLNSGYDHIRLISNTRKDIIVDIYENILPSQYMDVDIEFDWNEDNSVELQLEKKKKFLFEEIGIKPIQIFKNIPQNREK